MNDSVDDTWTSPAPPTSQPTATPESLAGRYRLLERIAAGGMATVWRGGDDVLARQVAIKILHEHLASDEDFRERFRREAVAAAKLTHPNVVGLYDTGRDGEQTFLVMEYVEGLTLKQRLSDGPLPPGQAARMGVQVARALAYAHGRGLVHRDVKPANILVSTDGVVKVTDFGIAKADQSEDLTRTGTMLGTAAYVAPEQVRGDPVTGAADQYSLGVVLYEALTGQQPYRGQTALATAAQRLEHDPPTPRSLQPNIPRSLESVVLRAMAQEPEDRFDDLGALAEALTTHADPEPEDGMGEPVPVSGVAGDDEAGGVGPRGRRPRGPLAAVALVAMLLAAGSGVAWVTDVDRLVDALPFVETTPAPQPVGPHRISVFDPFAGGSEREGDLPNLLDGDEETYWRTHHYEHPNFGGLKEGVGFVVDLGEEHFVNKVVLRAETEGVDVQLRIAETNESDLDAWTPVAAVEDGEDLVRLEPETPVNTQYLLVWLTGELPPSPYSSGQYTAEFSQLAILAQPPDE